MNDMKSGESGELVDVGVPAVMAEYEEPEPESDREPGIEPGPPNVADIRFGFLL